MESTRRKTTRQKSAAEDQKATRVKLRAAMPTHGRLAPPRDYGILDSLLEGCQIIDRQWRYVYLNPAGLQHAHRASDELIGRTMMECYPGIDRTEVFAVLQACMRDGLPRRMENEFVYPDGSHGWFDLSIEPVPEGLFILSADITERKRLQETITKNAQLLRLFVEHSPAAIAMLDGDMRYLVASQRYLKDYQLGEQDLTGRSHYEVFPEIPERWKEIHRRCLRGAVEAAAADPFPRADGSLDFVRWEVRPWYQAADRIGGLIIFSEVITEQVLAADALRMSEERFRGLYENSTLGIYRMTPDGRILLANPALVAMLGFASVHELEEHRVTEGGFESAGARAEFLDVMERNGEVRGFESAWQRKDGSYIFVRESARLTRGPDGSTAYIDGTVEDISVRKRTELERLVLAEIMQATALAAGLPEFLELMRKSLSQVLDAENLFVVLHNKSTGIFEEVFAVDKFDAPMPPSRLERSITSHVYHTGQSLLITPAVLDEMLQNGIVEQVGTRPAAWLGAPLVTPAGIIGVLAVQNYEDPNCYSDGDQRFLASIAAQVSVAIDRKRAQVDLGTQLERLSALRAIDLAISGSMDMKVSLDILLGQTVRALQVDAAAVYLMSKTSAELEYAAGTGFRGTGFFGSRIRVGLGAPGQAVLDRRTVLVGDVTQAGAAQPLARPIEQEGFVGLVASPLVSKGEVKGVLEVFQRSRLDPPADWMTFLESLAGQAAIAIDSAQIFSDLQRSSFELAMAYDSTIEGWSRAMDYRDKETEGHTQRVTEQALVLARSLGVPEHQLVNLRRGALLHDMGKLGVPDSILLKPGPLTDEEWKVMRQHPTFAYEMLKEVGYLREAIAVPYCHHEKWDGSGYPRGLRGEQIPLGARIFAVVDVWDALTSARPYRPAWSQSKTLTYIEEQSGKHFDPKVVEAFLSLNLADRTD